MSPVETVVPRERSYRTAAEARSLSMDELYLSEQDMHRLARLGCVTVADVQSQPDNELRKVGIDPAGLDQRLRQLGFKGIFGGVDG